MCTASVPPQVGRILAARQAAGSHGKAASCERRASLIERCECRSGCGRDRGSHKRSHIGTHSVFLQKSALRSARRSAKAQGETSRRPCDWSKIAIIVVKRSLHSNSLYVR